MDCMKKNNYKNKIIRDHKNFFETMTQTILQLVFELYCILSAFIIPTKNLDLNGGVNFPDIKPANHSPKKKLAGHYPPEGLAT